MKNVFIRFLCVFASNKNTFTKIIKENIGEKY